MLGLLGVLVLGETARVLLPFQAFRSGADLSLTVIICLSEVGKVLISLIALVRNRTSFANVRLNKGQSFQDNVLSYLRIMFPAALLMFNDLLFLVALHYGTPAVLQAFLMSKLPFSAAMHHFFIEPQYNLHAWAAITSIIIGLFVISRSESMYMQDLATAFSSPKSSSITEALAPPLYGVIIGLNSAVANVFMEKTRKPEVPFWVAQFYLYTFGALLAMAMAFVWGGHIQNHTSTLPSLSRSTSTISDGVDRMSYYSAIIPITALAGLTVSNPVGRQYNPVKLAWNSACIFAVFLAQVVLYPKLRWITLTPNMVVGTVMVALGAWTYEEASRTTTRRGAGTTKLWLFIGLAGAGIITMLIVVPEALIPMDVKVDNWVDDIAARAETRQKMVSHEVRSFSTSAGGEVRMHDMSWAADIEAARSSNGVRSFSTYRSLCVQVRPTIWWPTQYWLAGSEDVDDLGMVNLGANNTWTTAFRFLDRKKKIGLKKLSDYDGEIRWVNGTTFGYTKDEKGNHPAAVMRPWAALVSLATYGADILEQYGITADHFFDQYYLMGQIFDPSDWTNFTMSSALDAAVKSLPGGQYGSIFYPGQKNTVLELPPSHALGAPSWHDESEMTGRERPDGLVCFESLVMIHEHQHYFRDAVDAEYYRRVALKALNCPKPRIPACKPQGLRAVILARSRPLFNEDEISNLFQRGGLNVKHINIETIVADGTFQEQIDIFRGADILISVHGSHLNNQIFMEPTSTLIEVFPRLFYHNEQKRLAGMTGVNHIEITDNEYPEHAAFEKYYNESELSKIDECLVLGGKFLTAPRCYQDHDCRICHRSLGAQANMDRVRAALKDALSRFASAPGCSVPIEVPPKKYENKLH